MAEGVPCPPDTFTGSDMNTRYWRLPLLVLLACAACSGPVEQHARKTPAGRYYGGVFNANETEGIRSLFPLSLTQASSHRIAAQIYEGLVRLDQRDLTVVPGLAGSWEVDEDGLRYTFHLREGVLFHDDPCFKDGKGREFTAADVVSCFTRICTAMPENQMFWLFQDRITGANAHYAATVNDGSAPALEGVVAIDERTVAISLTGPWPGFLQVMAHQGCWIHPHELLDHYGAEARWHPVGTGPFRLKSFNKGSALVMERNPAYWGQDESGSPLPYLDGIRYTFEQSKVNELEAFQKGQLSVIYELPIDRTDILHDAGAYQVQSMPALTVQFYGFNSRKPPFNDVRVRKAFSMAIDRQLLVDSLLDGLAVVAEHGVVAPGFGDYPYALVPGVAFDPEGARKLLADAGYAGGRGLPTIFLQVNNSGFGYVKVAELVQTMFEKELGARVISSVLPDEQHFRKVEMGEALLWREGWIVDHPDPENFLALFYGRTVPADSTAPSFLNSTRYRNARYDSLFAVAQRSVSTEERMRTLALAEARMMEDAVVAPLYHERSVRLLQPWVRDLPLNGMEYRDLRLVWFDPAARSAP